MYSTCLHCTRPLGANEVVETLPIGRRLAFDAAQGRLWVVCRECAKWNLVPFDTRLESIEACERLYRDTKERYSTGTIGLAKAKEGLELVRIGPALLPEFASWRYGAQYRQRRRKALIVYGGSAVLPYGFTAAWMIGGLDLVGGVTGLGIFSVVHNALMWRILKKGVVGGPPIRTFDPATGEPLTLSGTSISQAMIRRREEGLDLAIPRDFITGRKLVFTGWEADRLTHRILGGLNAMSGSKRDLSSATDHVVGMQREEPRPLLERIDAFQRVKRWGTQIGGLDRHMRLAWEMLSNEEVERHWLGGELAMLEREWREAEQLAKIADDLAVSRES